VASLHSILILGPDAVAAASPATSAQLVHACRLWGFSAVVPASWGDELIATEVVRRCAAGPNRPVIQCSCPRVSERLAPHSALLDDAILWLVSPPVAVARYVKSMDAARDIHVTYAGACPGVLDSSIDEVISPFELLAAISARGIDVAQQPRVFENIIPADRRRYMSAPGGLPDQHQLWEECNYRVAQPAGADPTARVAQLLLSDERVLIDLGPTVGCICRIVEIDAGAELQRSPTPVVTGAVVDLSAPAPVVIATEAPSRTPDRDVRTSEPLPGPAVERPATAPTFVPSRASSVRPAYRRSASWRRMSPRPGAVIARPSFAALAVVERMPLLRRPAARWALGALIATGLLMLGIWLGRRSSRVDQPTSERRASRSTLSAPRAPARGL
jgi:hypothetical protein